MRGLEGNFQAQPRVFAHDAVELTAADITAGNTIANTSERGCCLYVGNSGAVEVTMESGNNALFNGVATGSFLPILVKNFVLTSGANNTTATNILALY